MSKHVAVLMGGWSAERDAAELDAAEELPAGVFAVAVADVVVLLTEWAEFREIDPHALGRGEVQLHGGLLAGGMPALQPPAASWMRPAGAPCSRAGASCRTTVNHQVTATRAAPASPKIAVNSTANGSTGDR